MKLQSFDNCGVCGSPLVYQTESRRMSCTFCGQVGSAMIHCPEGHYVCDSCHQREAIDVLRQVAESSDSTDPVQILEVVMSHPSVPMHGPEHHAMVPVCIAVAVRNAGFPVPEASVERALERGTKVPGGWCGFYGACGAAIGVGIAVSVLTEATPLTGRERSLANEATAFALGEMILGQPRCCKRESRKALEAAVHFFHTHMNMDLAQDEEVRCTFSGRNRECPKEECPYYAGDR